MTKSYAMVTTDGFAKRVVSSRERRFHREKVRQEARASLIDGGVDEPDAERVVAMIDEGVVAHVTIDY